MAAIIARGATSSKKCPQAERSSRSQASTGVGALRGGSCESASLWEVVARIDAVAGTEIDQGILALLHLNHEAPFRRADVVVGHLVDARWDLLELVVAVAIRTNVEAHRFGGAVRRLAVEMDLERSEE